MGNVIVSNITRTPVENGSNWGSVAAPSSPGLTGTFAEGNTITLAGSGYGTLGVTTKYDDFEDGTNGQLISARPDWKTDIGSGGIEPIVTSSDSYAGSLSGLASIIGGGDSATYLTGDFTEVYIAFAYKGTIESGTSAKTVKGFRVHANDGPNIYTSYPAIFEQEIVDQYSNNGRRFTVAPGQADGSGNESSLYPGGVSAGSWHYLEYYFKQGDAGVANGVVQSWDDLSIGSNASTTTITNDSGVTNSWKLAMLPFYWGNGSGGTHRYDIVHLSFDQGKARVMAGDNAVFSSCTKLEAMNTLTRVDGEITFKVPANTFTPASTVYIHVIDIDGTSTNTYSTTVTYNG